MIKKERIAKHALLFGACFALSLQSHYVGAEVQSGDHVGPLFEVFDSLEGREPAALQGSSTLTMDDGSSGWLSGSEWYSPQIFTEDQVFHRELQHRSPDGDWDIRIGKGGQLYSWNVDGVGELIPPQSSDQSPWMDLVFLATVRDSDNHNNDALMNGEWYGNGFVHAAGMYIKPWLDPLNDEPFYSPMFAEQFNSSERSYSALTLGVVPYPSINRSDVLFYTKYKFLGGGVLEITYYCYNFGEGTFRDNAFPWAAVRHSVFPNTVRSTTAGGYESFEGTYPNRFNLRDQGGWIAKTQNSADNTSFSLSTVHGLDHHYDKSWQNSVSFASSGYPSNWQTTERDFSLMTAVNRIHITPGTGFYWRTYMVMGELNDVSEKSYELVNNMDYGLVELSEYETALIPIYATTIDGQQALTTEQPDSASALFHTYSMPVRNSTPLFLVKDNDTGSYYVTTDQYAVSGQLDFIDDNGVLTDRVVHQPYDLKTEWVALLGYVMPSEDALITRNTVTLGSLKVGNFKFNGGDKYTSEQLLVRTDDGSEPITVAQRYEAENATIAVGFIKSRSDASAGEYVDGEGGFNLTFDVESSGGDNNLEFGIKVPSGTRTMGVFINGEYLQDISSSSTTWDVALVNATLNQGTNTVELRDSAGTAEFDVDYLDVTTLSTIEDVLLEAEEAEVSRGIIKSLEDASNGLYVDGNGGFNLIFETVGENHQVNLDFRVKVPSGSRTVGVFVNNIRVGAISSVSKTWEIQSVTTQLIDGLNTIELRDSEGAAEPDVDYLQVVYLTDFDGDGEPDLTDVDDDNDGVEDALDAFPLDAVYGVLGDFDDDQDIDRSDMALFTRIMRTPESIRPEFDFNGDGQVNPSDVGGLRALCTRTSCAE